jgi:hypothetical protein
MTCYNAEIGRELVMSLILTDNILLTTRRE